MSTLPRLATVGGGVSSALSPQQWALFHDAQRWLSSQKARLGANKHVELANPHPTLKGLTCELNNVVELDDDLIPLFKQYNDLCGNVKTARNDARGGHVFSVALATNVTLPVSDAKGGSSSSGLAGRILDEPKPLISLILLVSVCAAFTTSGESWIKVAHGLYALLSLAPFHP